MSVGFPPFSYVFLPRLLPSLRPPLSPLRPLPPQDVVVLLSQLDLTEQKEGIRDVQATPSLIGEPWLAAYCPRFNVPPKRS